MVRINTISILTSLTTIYLLDLLLQYVYVEKNIWSQETLNLVNVRVVSNLLHLTSSLINLIGQKVFNT